MNITIYVHSLNGGGAEHVAAMWANGFCSKGHNVSIIIHEKTNGVKYNQKTSYTIQKT